MWLPKISSLNKHTLIVAAVTGTLVVLLLVATHDRLAWNPTPSNPFTFFWITRVSAETMVSVERDKYYVFRSRAPCNPGGKQQLLVKEAKCLPADVLTVKGLNYYCGDNWMGSAKIKTAKGEPTNPFVFSGLIPEGKIFVVGHYVDAHGTDHSCDSRYMGFIDTAEIAYTATPLI